MYIIKHVNHQWDVFSGRGYWLHSRLRISPDGQVSLVYGERLPNAVVKQLVEKLDVRKHYQTLDLEEKALNV